MLLSMDRDSGFRNHHTRCNRLGDIISPKKINKKFRLDLEMSQKNEIFVTLFSLFSVNNLAHINFGGSEKNYIPLQINKN